jgi:hypothetical protein
MLFPKKARKNPHLRMEIRSEFVAIELGEANPTLCFTHWAIYNIIETTYLVQHNTLSPELEPQEEVKFDCTLI